MSKTFRIKRLSSQVTGPIDTRGNAVYTGEEIDAINKAYNRRRISGSEMDSMIGLISAGNLFRQCAVQLEDHAIHTGNRALLRRVCTSIKTIAVRMANQVEARQLGAVLAQTDDAKVTVSAAPHESMVNIRLTDLLHICNRAMEQCDLCCTCTRDQSKECELRHALDLVPCVKQAAKEIARKDAHRCPYRGMEMEVEL